MNKNIEIPKIGPEIIAGHEFKAIVRNIPLFRDDTGEWKAQMYLDNDGAYWVRHVGDLISNEPIVLRVDDHCMTGFDLIHMPLGGHPETACDCRQQSQESKRLIQEYGRGIVIHTPHEARGHGPVAKALQLKLQAVAILKGEHMPDTYECFEMTGFTPPDIRNYDAIRAILYDLGLKDHNFILITNNSRKVQELIKFGVNVAGHINVYDPENPDYYSGANFDAKAKDGHDRPPEKIPANGIVFHCEEFIVAN